ncbi:cryptochrome-2-like [Dreissena polymorpha]|nr:cryptochrome-2-like [Dreissena polymorpha]
MTQRSVHWFRKGLRLHDNPALNAACENASHVWPVFVLDPWFARFAKVGVNRWRFLLQSLVDLNNQLKVHNSRLYVVKGSPKEVFPRIFKKWGITRLTFEVDTEPYARQRDMDVEKIAREFHVEVVKCVSHTLYDTERIIAKNGGSPPLTYQRFQTVLSQLGPPPKAVSLNKEQLAKCRSPDGTDDEEGYDVPSLEDLGKREEDCGPCLYPGGETEALRRIDYILKKPARVCAFEKPETDPNSLEPSTSVLSPYLKFGCLSPRLFYNRLAEIYKCKNHSQSPVSHGELLWREFFYTVAAGTPNFNKMVGNPVCIQVDWDTNDELLTAWKTGRTGYPFIDAIMTQLKDEGWIHHLDRHAVAWFLTRGDLWISWEEGQKVFEEYLLDADYSLNAANWLLASGSALFQQNSSVYNPVDFGKSTDKQGDFIRKYVPILKEFPEKYIYEPWTAPIDVQEKFGCIIGEDYPKPIVDHEAARKKNIERMAAAYARRNGSKDAGR